MKIWEERKMNEEQGRERENQASALSVLNLESWNVLIVFSLSKYSRIKMILPKTT